MQTVDLHLHSVCSDGVLTVGEVLRRCNETGVHSAAIADHDTFDHLAQIQTVSNLSVQVVPAVEVTTEWCDLEVHVLVYFPSTNGELARRVRLAYVERCERFRWIVATLAETGWQLDISNLHERCDNSWVIAGAYLQEPRNQERLRAEGINTVPEFRRAYLDSGTIAYAPRPLVPVTELISRARDEMALPFLAHPAITFQRRDQQDTAIAELAQMGLCGIEVFYGGHNSADTHHLRAMTEPWKLLESAGSDFHAPVDGQQIGGWELYGLTPRLSWIER